MWKAEGDTRIGLVITAKARALIDGEGIETIDETIVNGPTYASPRPGSKNEAVLALLHREEGAYPRRRGRRPALPPHPPGRRHAEGGDRATR